jgi:hypothetical protein
MGGHRDKNFASRFACGCRMLLFLNGQIGNIGLETSGLFLPLGVDSWPGNPFTIRFNPRRRR